MRQWQVLVLTYWGLDLMIAVVTVELVEDQWVRVVNDVMLSRTRAAHGAQERRDGPPRAYRIGGRGGGRRRHKRNATDVQRSMRGERGLLERRARLAAKQVNASGRWFVCAAGCCGFVENSERIVAVICVDQTIVAFAVECG